MSRSQRSTPSPATCSTRSCSVCGAPRGSPSSSSRTTPGRLSALATGCSFLRAGQAGSRTRSASTWRGRAVLIRLSLPSSQAGSLSASSRRRVCVSAEPMAEPLAAAELAAPAETLAEPSQPRQPGRFLSWLWPKLAAVALGLGIWQVVVWSGWKPDYVLPGPLPVLQRLAQDLSRPDFYIGVGVTLRRAFTGYAIAVLIGSAVGLLVARVPIVRKAVGHAILGLQSMPSIAWFPLAILLFQLTEGAILFVVILGAAPAVTVGLLHGVDHVQPLLVRVGRVMGARGLGLYRYVILPAALPGFVSGLKQGWAFAWRSLMAGEIIGVVSHVPSLGQQLQVARDFADAEQLLALMIVIFVIGVVVDLAFGFADRSIRRRWGLLA